MRKHSVCAALALALCLAAAGAVVAKPKSRTLTFGSDFRVGSTLVKAGTYKFTYDDKTGEVSISDKTSTLARAAVKVEQREKAKTGWDVVLAQKGDGLSSASRSPATSRTSSSETLRRRALQTRARRPPSSRKTLREVTELFAPTPPFAHAPRLRHRGRGAFFVEGAASTPSRSRAVNERA
jgi:hypothetical protein